MADVFSKEKRSKIMSKIRSRETKPEIRLRKELWKNGLRFRKSYKLSGKPDIVFLKKKLAIFVDGCFWHKCPKCYRQPKSNKEYWIPKIKYNVEKDKRINKALNAEGWKILRFWEHEIKKDLDKCVDKVIKILNED